MQEGFRTEDPVAQERLLDRARELFRKGRRPPASVLALFPRQPPQDPPPDGT
jgi:hypothetical protein